jgi:hypothetical protein
MGKDELDGVRQVLETALNTLRDDASSAESVRELNSFEGRAHATPVIVIMAGGPAPHLEQSRSGSAKAEAPVTPSSSFSAYNERKVSHPGLERFTIETDSRPAAPTKPCFMEPGRSCVNSGACEMRGF